jgi:hypothetical protein
MQILRVPSSTIAYTVDDLVPNAEYEFSWEDLTDNSVFSGTVVANQDGVVSISLPSNRDGEYEISFGDIDEIVTVVRPYVDPTTKGMTASEISQYAKNEELARAIIDSVIDDGFYYNKKVIETTGNGSDYIPLWVNANKVLEVYENNVLVYDAENPSNYEFSYSITKDKTAIVKSYAGEINRLESAELILPAAGSDIIGTQFVHGTFPKTYDYTIILEVGYKKLPSNIVRAAELLVDDIACGKLDYYKRYVSDYSTDQFKIKFDSRSFEGTGNIVVDKILLKYFKSIRSIGVL